jgi:hypothetical protein
MAQQDGGGNGFATAEVIAAASEHSSSVDGFGAAAPEGPFAEHPELLLCAGFFGGVLLAGMVSRLGR